VNTDAYLIHPLGSAWYPCFCFTFIKIPISTKNAEQHPKQNKQNQPTNQKKNLNLKSRGIDKAMLHDETTK
jgi:hypothetical protein